MVSEGGSGCRVPATICHANRVPYQRSRLCTQRYAQSPNPPPNAPSLQAFGYYPTPSGFRSGVLAHSQPTCVAHRLAAVASTGIDRAHARQDVCGDPRGRDKSRVELLEVVERVTTERSEGLSSFAQKAIPPPPQNSPPALTCLRATPTSHHRPIRLSSLSS
jgi:hypothetical protein